MSPARRVTHAQRAPRTRHPPGGHLMLEWGGESRVGPASGQEEPEEFEIADRRNLAGRARTSALLCAVGGGQLVKQAHGLLGRRYRELRPERVDAQPELAHDQTPLVLAGVAAHQ